MRNRFEQTIENKNGSKKLPKKMKMFIIYIQHISIRNTMVANYKYAFQAKSI